MKKIFYLMATVLAATMFPSCSDNDDSDNSKLEEDFFSIENATYNEGDIPESTTSETLKGIDMSDQVMNGAMNYISVVTDQKVLSFFVGVKGVKGYFEYEPESSAPGAIQGYNTYIIPVMMSQKYKGNSTIVLSGKLANGNVTAPVENKIYYIETMPGAIEIKLAFSNSKDVDLHLYTPSGEHIYYGNRGGVYTDEDGNEISYGLDIDSNAGCTLDNINKENIYIPAQLVEDGTYKVVVDMYSNCNPSIATSWSVVARYQGKMITPVTGSNPASGTYPVGAGSGDMTQVMTFKIHNGSVTRGGQASEIRNNWKFTPEPLSEAARYKVEAALN